MIVLCISNCPPGLRGDLSKWLMEINTGVYIGRTSARVREEIWKRVRENISDGQATMIYSSNNSQGYAILVHNSKWTPVDFEGITLMRRPLTETSHDFNTPPDLKQGFSDAAHWQMLKHSHKKKNLNYVILDIETTGLDSVKDKILELGAIRIKNGEPEDELHAILNSGGKIADEIVDLTGITEEIIAKGVDEKTGVTELLNYVGSDLVMGYNVQFDLGFLQETCNRIGIEYSIMKAKDILPIVRKKLDDVKDYRMITVAEHLGIQADVKHRALPDCRTIYRIYEKLNEL